MSRHRDGPPETREWKKATKTVTITSQPSRSPLPVGARCTFEQRPKVTPVNSSPAAKLSTEKILSTTATRRHPPTHAIKQCRLHPHARLVVMSWEGDSQTTAPIGRYRRTGEWIVTRVIDKYPRCQAMRQGTLPMVINMSAPYIRAPRPCAHGIARVVFLPLKYTPYPFPR